MIDRFWAKVIKADGCWLWAGRLDKDGYGKFKLMGRHVRAHRVSYELNIGEIPDKLWVLHHCDNPSCVRPEHLYLGTNIENVRDRTLRGRHRFGFGSKHGMAKLTEQDIIAIRADTRTLREIASDYQITFGHIGAIKRREEWKHVP